MFAPETGQVEMHLLHPIHLSFVKITCFSSCCILLPPEDFSLTLSERDAFVNNREKLNILKLWEKCVNPLHFYL